MPSRKIGAATATSVSANNKKAENDSIASRKIFAADATSAPANNKTENDAIASGDKGIDLIHCNIAETDWDS